MERFNIKSKLYFLSATRFFFEPLCSIFFSSALHFAISSAVISFISVFFFHNKALVCSCFNFDAS
jgi:hypothetical protein